MATRSVATLGLGDSISAERLARESLAKSDRNRQARWVLVRVGLGRARFAEVEAQLDTLLALQEHDHGARQLRDRLARLRTR